MITTRRALAVAAALTFVLASCGGSSDGGADVTATTPATEATVDDGEDFTEVDGTAADSADSDPVASDVTDPSDETSATDPEATDATDESSATEPATEPADTADGDGGDEGAATAGAEVSLVEWAIDAPTEYSAGEITFTASNNGSFPHELVVIEGQGYESLPLEEGGAVIEDELPTGALIGRTGRIGGGSSEELTVTLAPGTYVFVCNLGGGGNSHAGQGQRLDVTVS